MVQHTPFNNITVIGAGTMGNGIAHTFAQYGYQVSLFDISAASLATALQAISSNLDRQVAKELILPAQKVEILARIKTYTDLREASTTADLAVEAATENKVVKLEIFKTLDAYTPPSCILASNTSSISIHELAQNTLRPDHVVGMHFMNPVPVMKLVEVVKTAYTDAQVVQKIQDTSTSLEKIPVLVNDAPGFISNRILMPMINEAVHALSEGIAGVAEIDTIMKLGMAHPMGPLRLADLIGLDVCVFILNVLHEGFANNPKYAPCTLLQTMVTAGELGVKSGKGFYQYSKDKKEPLVAERFS